MFEKEIAALLKKELNEDVALETPPDPKLGDYAFPCFLLAKKLKKGPFMIAQEIAQKLKPTKFIGKIEAKGPYVNFYIDKAAVAETVISEIQQKKELFGSSASGAGKKAVIEFPAPNTNKPLHLGHLRNMALGDCISRLFESQGYKVFRVNLNNDRGIHVCKSMLAYKKWGNSRMPDKKSDHFVGDFYVMFAQKAKENPELESEAQEMLRLWEAGDKGTRELWEMMNQWALDGFEETYTRFGLKQFDKVYYESETYLKGRELVMKGLEKGLFYKTDDGAIVANLNSEGLGDKALIRADGTTIYITQDLYLAHLKHEDFNYDLSVYVVAREQEHHFNVLFKLLNLLGCNFAGGCYHFSYGLVLLPEGKMKSREGIVVDADDLMIEMEDLAKEEVIKRYKELNEEEIHDRARLIGLGALKFFLLKIDAVKDMTFHPKESISFEGETGPYVQYAHARICSIFARYGKPVPQKVNFKLLKEEKEAALITLLAGYPLVVSDACMHYKPSLVTRFLLNLTKAFNEFYESCPVLTAEGKLRDSRLVLCDCVRTVLKNGLSLLGITAPERM